MAKVGEIFELKNCPFCGGRPHQLPHSNFDRFTGYSFFCDECKASTPVEKTDEEARAAWNRRAPDPERDEDERCIACAIPFKPGDIVLSDAGGGLIHAACCGPERESYTGEDGEPLKDGEPIPTGWAWSPDTCALSALLSERDELREALRPFAAVAQYDIGDSEASEGRFMGQSSPHNRAPLLTVGDFRSAAFTYYASLRALAGKGVKG